MTSQVRTLSNYMLPQKAALNRNEAAAYVGVGISLFDQMVRDGKMPHPRNAGTSRKIWLRDELDEKLHALPTTEQQTKNPWDDHIYDETSL